MTVGIFKYIIQFLFLVLLQGLVLNNIQISGYINPYLYILFLITLPCSLRREYVLIIAFFLGLSVDLFSNTHGIHAFACVFTAFIRHYLIQGFAPRDDYEDRNPSMAYFGLASFTRYIVLMILIHHTCLFLVDFFSLKQPIILLLRILFSSIFTFLMIFFIEKFKTR